MGITVAVINLEVELERVAKRIQELAQDGKPPTCRIFDGNRGGCLSSDAFDKRGYSWLDLVELAGFPVRRVRFGTVEEEIQKTIIKLREIAVNGVMPSKATYNKARGDCYSAEALRETCRMTWYELAQRADLYLLQTGVRRETFRESEQADREVDEAKQAARQALQRVAHGLPVFDTPRREWTANGRTFVAWGVR